MSVGRKTLSVCQNNVAAFRAVVKFCSTNRLVVGLMLDRLVKALRNINIAIISTYFASKSDGVSDDSSTKTFLSTVRGHSFLELPRSWIS